MKKIEAHARFGREHAKRNAALVGAFRLQMMGLVHDIGKLLPDVFVLDTCATLAVAQVLHAAMAGLEEEADSIVEVTRSRNTDTNVSETRETKP